MQKIHISSWLEAQTSAAELTYNTDDEIELDFSNVEEIRLNDIESLLNLQRFAVFNELKLHVENMKPHITKLFEQTGLYKLLTFGNTIDVKITKRMGLAFD